MRHNLLRSAVRKPHPLAHTASSALSAAVRQRAHRSAQPRCSVIVCTYNRRDMVLSTLASLRRQTLPYQMFEVLVVDNGSHDGTMETVYRYVNAGMQQRPQREQWRVRCLREPQNGLAYARNRGLQAASGEIVVFLDDDSLADPTLLERLLVAYEETEADVIAPRISLRWEAPRPHWLTDDLLDLLGYFAPAGTSTLLQAGQTISSCCFSARRATLLAIGGFTPLLSKRQSMPVTGEMYELCQRLRQANYRIWYEEQARVSHRIVAARLQRAYFVGRAYWQGRSEVMQMQTSVSRQEHSRSHTEIPTPLLAFLRVTLLPLVLEWLYLTCFLRPLLVCARASTNERLLTAMAQARCWGLLRQQLASFHHVPLDGSHPTVLLILPEAADTTDTTGVHLAEALVQQGIICQCSTAALSLSWLWRYRAYGQQCIGILHFYRPGAYRLTFWQRQRMYILLRLAHRWGIPVVSSDTGGWWQNVRTARFRHQRTFERHVFAQSQMIFSAAPQPAQLYPEPLRQRVRRLPLPGFRGILPPPVEREMAFRQLGLPAHVPCVLLSFADQHTERELLMLLDAFQEICNVSAARLLLVGIPRDTPQATQMLRRVALNPAVHLFFKAVTADDMPLYMGAAHVVVQPYATLQQAGAPELAMLALSYERVVVVPRLPRFDGVLLPNGSIFFDAGSRTSLAQALRKAQSYRYQISAQDALYLDAHEGWKRHVQRLKDFYLQLNKNEAES